jgi:DNA-directed RNA polymerase subunit RPC12/RpoP
MSKIIDITGKKTVNCTECGFTIQVPPRELSMEKLRHMRDVRKVADLLKKTGADKGASNIRILICSNCSSVLACKDEFTDT